MQPTTDKKKIPCIFYAKGYCKNGENCPYSHDASVVREQQKPEPKRSTAGLKKNNRVNGTVNLHNAEITHMTKLEGNNLLLTVSKDRNVYVWNQDLDGSFLLKGDATITSTTAIGNYAFLGENMQNDQQMITAVAVVNLKDRTQYYLQSGLTSSILHLSYSPEFHYLYCIQSNGSITVYNADTSFSLITTLSLGTPICCALIRDTIVYACSTEGELLILDMKTNSGFRRMYFHVPMENMYILDGAQGSMLLTVYRNGQLLLHRLSDMEIVSQGSVGSNVKASAVYRDKKGEWMIMSSCSRFAKEISLSVIAVKGFEPRGLMKQCTSAIVTSLVNIGKKGEEGDFIVAGCEDGSMTVFNMSA